MKHLIITGANRGIGLEILKGINKEEYNIILAVRSVEKGRKAIASIQGEIDVMEFDVSKEKSIVEFVREYKTKYHTVDVFINNAGIFTNYEQRIPFLGNEIEAKWVVNALGPYYLLELLKPCFTKGSKLIIMGSVAGHNLHLNLDSMYGKGSDTCYGDTKYANLLMISALAKYWSDTIVLGAHPGYTNTDIFDGYQNKSIRSIVKKASYILGQSPENGAQPMLEALSGNYPSLTYIVPNGFKQLYGKPRQDLLKNYIHIEEVSTLIEAFNDIVISRKGELA